MYVDLPHGRADLRESSGGSPPACRTAHCPLPPRTTGRRTTHTRSAGPARSAALAGELRSHSPSRLGTPVATQTRRTRRSWSTARSRAPPGSRLCNRTLAWTASSARPATSSCRGRRSRRPSHESRRTHSGASSASCSRRCSRGSPASPRCTNRSGSGSWLQAVEGS